MQALKCFSVLAFENPQVSMTLVNGRLELLVTPMCLISELHRFRGLSYSLSSVLFPVLVDGELLPQIFVKMLQRDKPIEMQLTSAKW